MTCRNRVLFALFYSLFLADHGSEAEDELLDAFRLNTNYDLTGLKSTRRIGEKPSEEEEMRKQSDRAQCKTCH